MSATPPSRHALSLDVLREVFAVCRLPPDAPVPEWATRGGPLSAVVRTADELSILVASTVVPANVLAERGYRAMRVRGTLPFDLVGIFASLAQPLADAQLSIFALSTYDTDFVLVKERDLDRALDVLRAAGHEVTVSP